MVDGVAKSVKYSMFAINGIILIGGLVKFSVGVWTLAFIDLLSIGTFMGRILGTNLYVTSASLLITAGVIFAIISLLGFLGAYKEIRCILLTFVVILLFI